MKNKLFYLLLLILFSCLTSDKSASNKPNILWLFTEDLSPWIKLYGDNTISTPTIDNLAAQGVLFQKTITPNPVCSPSRSSVIIGSPATKYGVHHHRGQFAKKNNKIHLPKNIKPLPNIFKNEGFYTFNLGKNDYNFDYNNQDLYTYHTHIRRGTSLQQKLKPLLKKLKENKKEFFGQIQLSGGKSKVVKKYTKQIKNITVPPYYPNTKLMQSYVKLHYNNIKKTDS